MRRKTPIPEPRNTDAETIYVVSVIIPYKIKGCTADFTKSFAKLTA